MAAVGYNDTVQMASPIQKAMWFFDVGGGEWDMHDIAGRPNEYEVRRMKAAKASTVQ